MPAPVRDNRAVLADEAKDTAVYLRFLIREMRDTERMGWTEIANAVGLPSHVCMVIARETVGTNAKKAPEYRR